MAQKPVFLGGGKGWLLGPTLIVCGPLVFLLYCCCGITIPSGSVYYPQPTVTLPAPYDGGSVFIVGCAAVFFALYGLWGWLHFHD